MQNCWRGDELWEVTLINQLINSWLILDFCRSINPTIKKIPQEECDIIPRTVCKKITKLVPSLREKVVKKAVKLKSLKVAELKD